MMRKVHVAVILICLFLSVGVVSCKKNDKQPTIASRIYGKWKKVQFSTDDNANGVLDDWEIHDAPANITNTLEFKKDSTGVELTTNSPDLPFTWSVTAELTMTFSYNSSDTIVYKITRINSSSLHLSTKTKNGLVGYYYKRY